jgi:WD40 repeat protein
MVTIFDTASGEQPLRLCCHSGRVMAIDFNLDGSLLATAGLDGVARIWDAESGRQLFILSGSMAAIQDLVFSSECTAPPQSPFTTCSRYLYSASRDGIIKQWDVSPAGNRDLLTAQGEIAAFTPDGKQFEVYQLIANPGFDRPNQNRIQSWQIQSEGEPEQLAVSELPPLPAPIVAGDIAVFPDKTIVIIASEDGSVQTWPVGHPQEMTAYTVPISPGEDNWIGGVYILPEGLRMVTEEYQDSTQIWDIASGEILSSVPAWGAVALSPDGRLLAIGSEDGSVSLWKLPSGELLQTIAAHAQMVTNLSFSPDNQRLATGSFDLTARVWDLSTGAELFTLAHPATTDSVTFSPDGRHLAVNQADGSLYLWDIDPASPTAGQLLSTFRGLDAYPFDNGFSPDGRIVFISAWFEQVIRLYILPLDDLMSLARSRLTRGFTPEECQRFRISSCQGEGE